LGKKAFPFRRRLNEDCADQGLIGRARPMGAEDFCRRGARPVMWGTSSEVAYEAFLEGKYGFNLSSREALAESRRSFERAVELDPGFGRALSALSYAFVQEWLQGWAPEGTLERAGRLAERATVLAPADYFTHWHLAFYLLAARRFDAAMAETETALALNPDSQDLLVEMAEALICAGRLEDGVRLIERARRTADLDRWEAAWRRCMVARGAPNGFDEALAVLNGLHRKPGDPRCLIDFQLLTAAMGAGELKPASNGVKPQINGRARSGDAPIANGNGHHANGHVVNGVGANGHAVNGTPPANAAPSPAAERIEAEPRGPDLPAPPVP
jgi:tetratricopeptide (TPR) repeat protein